MARGKDSHTNACTYREPEGEHVSARGQKEEKEGKTFKIGKDRGKKNY